MKSLRTKSGVAILLTFAGLLYAGRLQAQQTPTQPVARPHYQIQIKLDFDSRSYTGSQTIHWLNRSDHSISVIYFHLYSNLRSADSTSVVNGRPTSLEDEEPRIEITEVRSANDKAPLNYSLEERGVVLRVNLRDAVPPGMATDVLIGFKGSVPEVDPEETGLTTHVVKQISAALRSERELRRARDVNLRSRGVMLLGTAYPVLVVYDGDDWQKKVDPGIGDLTFNETADYDVSVEAAPGVQVFAPAAAGESSAGLHNFSADMLRDFAILAGRNLRSEQRDVGEIKVQSIFLAEHERIGRRVLQNAADAVRIFRSKFGPLPFQSITVAEAPLVAGLGSTDFAGLDVIASAFYVDFDAPAVRNLPEIIREQQPAVEQSVEWTVARLIGHQWWGAVIGNNPSREPVLDEALAAWSALLYFRELYGEQKANAIMNDQLRGVYRLYRTFGGPDLEADQPSRDYHNTFQYSAVVTTKGALMLVQLQRIMGEQKLLAALTKYYQQNQGNITTLNDLRDALLAETAGEQRRLVARTLDRWLSSKRGDEDIAPPDQELATSLGLPSRTTERRNDRNALGAFARVGKFFWQQMTRIR